MAGRRPEPRKARRRPAFSENNDNIFKTMKISKTDFNAKLVEYITTRIMPSMGNKLGLFLVAAAVQTNRIGTDLVGDNTLKMLGIMDEEGKIETEAVRAAMTAGMK